MPRLTTPLVNYPARASLTWYLGLIAVGTALLMHPWCRAEGKPPLSVLDAAFTATSAACVTGLVVRSTGEDFSWLGQLVVLGLIQLGGIGIMTVTTFVMFRLGGAAGLRERLLVSQTLGSGTDADLRWVLRNVILLTLACEAIGFVLLLARMGFDYPPGEAIWAAAFHSVSAFCNAGFSLWDDSLTRYQADPIVNVTVMGLIVVGGLGFPVLLDLGRHRSGTWAERWDRLHIHTKTMLLGSAGLLAVGFAAFLLLEWDNTLAGMPWYQRPLVALFHSVTSRTAGFNTVDVGGLTNATLFLTILLMMIGAGPCSTAGGLKVSTFMVMVYGAWSTFRGYARVNIFRRTLSHRAIARASATALVFAALATVALTALLMLEQSQLSHYQAQGLFLDAVFEVFSALGTVGLSTGLTGNLTAAGKVIVILLMFAGRLGPISVVLALSRSQRSQPLAFPEEELLVG